MIRNQATYALAVTAGVLAGAVVFATPAAAFGPLADGAGDWRHYTYYVDRATTKRIAGTLESWSSTGDTLTQLGASAGCLRAGNPVAMAVCGAVVGLGMSYLADEVRQAGRTNACLAVTFDYGVPGLTAFQDDGRYCKDGS